MRDKIYFDYKYLFILLLSIPLAGGCKSTKSPLVLAQKQIITSSIEIKCATEYKIGSMASFEIYNNTNSSITIYNPWQIRIERYDDNTWQKVKIINCPCSADCNAPSKTLILKPKEKHSLSWNLKEGWCSIAKQNELSEAIEKNSNEGQFKIIVEYDDGESRQLVFKEFRITN